MISKSNCYNLPNENIFWNLEIYSLFINILIKLCYQKSKLKEIMTFFIFSLILPDYGQSAVPSEFLMDLWLFAFLCSWRSVRFRISVYVCVRLRLYAYVCVRSCPCLCLCLPMTVHGYVYVYVGLGPFTFIVSLCPFTSAIELCNRIPNWTPRSVPLISQAGGGTFKAYRNPL